MVKGICTKWSANQNERIHWSTPWVYIFHNYQKFSEVQTSGYSKVSAIEFCNFSQKAKITDSVSISRSITHLIINHVL